MSGMKKTPRADASAGTMGLFAAAVVLFAGLIAGGQANAGEAGAATWRVGEIQGEARIRTAASPWRMLGQGDVIDPNSEIETSATGRIRLASRRGSIIVLPESRFGFRALPGQPGIMPGIIHRTGKLQFGIATTPATPLRIKTPFLMAAIADATFTITVKQNKVALYVAKGAARVMSVLTGEEAMLQPHQLAWVSAPNGGQLKTIMMRPRTAPRVGGKLQARLAISQPTG